MRRSTPTGLPSPPHRQSVQPARMCDARAPQDSPTPWQNFCWLKSRLVLSPVLRLPEEEEYLYGPYGDRFCSTPSRRGAATTPLFCGPCCHGYTFAQTHSHNSVFILIRDAQQLCYTTVPPRRQCRDATLAGELSGVWLRQVVQLSTRASNSPGNKAQKLFQFSKLRYFRGAVVLFTRHHFDCCRRRKGRITK